ncbi:unnamed protein product [Gulo gulo]|uniref:Uncharacterized protein n=1 Tax=Gulo gulo TaxID=48420 RepID=A0A9X9LQW3_GULGU|nr:unnamed protein product [Gulo gulo]
MSHEPHCFHQWVIFAVPSHITTRNSLDRSVLAIEAHTAPKQSFALRASRCISTDFTAVVTLTGAKVTRFKNTRLPSAHRASTNTTNCGDVLKD